NLTTIDISDQLEPRPEETAEPTQEERDTGALTIVAMGSDRRTGSGNGGYGHFEGARSDTTMVLHIYPGRESAIVVSVPRDTVVTLPTCKDEGGGRLPAVRARFNEAFDRGGPGCTVKAVEAISGLAVDHFVVLDFNGFKRAINALGGVEVCLTHPLKDAKSGVDLPAGRTRVKGEDALAFVRVRHNIGDGSDISRINRQQLFLSSLIQEVTDSGMLTDPVRLWRVLDETSKSLTTDPGMADPDGIIALATSLMDISPKDVTFVTLPWRPSGDGATVVVDQARSAQIWRAIRKERPWPPPGTKGADGKKLTVVPTSIRVDVHNATGQEGAGSRAADDLIGQGFRIGVINARTSPARATMIRYAPGQRQAARTLQAAIEDARLREDASLGQRLDLTLGKSYSGVESIRVKAPGSGSSAQGATAAQDICTG
ncbi:MAG: LCP family protein, partial [Candidatus Nanopelagicales bacterium]